MIPGIVSSIFFLFFFSMLLITLYLREKQLKKELEFWRKDHMRLIRELDALKLGQKASKGEYLRALSMAMNPAISPVTTRMMKIEIPESSIKNKELPSKTMFDYLKEDELENNG